MVDEDELPLRVRLDEAVGRERVGDRTERRAGQDGCRDRQRRGAEADPLQQATPVHRELVLLVRIHSRSFPFVRFVEVHATLLTSFVQTFSLRGERNSRCNAVSSSKVHCDEGRRHRRERQRRPGGRAGVAGVVWASSETMLGTPFDRARLRTSLGSMKTRRLGKSELRVSEVGFGAWAIGGSWGQTDDGESLAALHAAVDAGVTFFDTADVYGDGRSERLLGRLLTERTEKLVVATKFGRGAPQDVAQPHLRPASLLARALAREPGRRDRRPRSAPLPSLGDLLHAGRVRRLRAPRRGAARGRIRGERGKGRGGVEGDRVPGCRNRADHLQHLPPATSRALLRSGAPTRCRRHRAGCRSPPGCSRAS